MIPEDKVEFAKLMTSIAELHGKKLSTKLLEIYWRALIDYELYEIKNALNTHAKDPDCGQYMPKPADIVRFVSGNNNDQALLAWSKVLKAVSSVGSYNSIIFDDSIIHIVLNEMGGWIKICQTLEESLPYLGKEFQNRYRFYLRHTPYKYPKKLVGIIEHTNSIKGHDKEPEVLFGDHKLALKVYRNGNNPEELISCNKLPIKKLLPPILNTKS